MTVVITKNATPEEIAKALEKLKGQKTNKKLFDAGKYAGKLKRGLDGLTYQKQLRNEWQ